MADDERAAKAARAKAMLKKRQSKAAGSPSVSSVRAGVAGIGSPAPSVAFSPPPSEAALEEERSEAGDFRSRSPFFDHIPSRHASHTHSRIASPPPRPTSRLAQKPITSPVETDWQTLTQSQQQTISLLVSEKAALATSLEQLQDVDARRDEVEMLLDEERQRREYLGSRVLELEHDTRTKGQHIEAAEGKAREAIERSREQDRQIDTLERSLAEGQSRIDDQQARIRTLEEKIQSDDALDVLRASLARSETHAEELEFQLNKLRQVHATLKTERDTLARGLEEHSSSEASWISKHRDLTSQHDALQSNHKSLQSAHDTLTASHSTLSEKCSTSEASLSQLTSRFSELTAELSEANASRKLLQDELSAAVSRAESADAAHKALQVENVEMMERVEEMRAKLVQLTEDKVELTHKVESLTQEGLKKDDTIARLTNANADALSDLESLKASRDIEVQALRKELESTRTELEKTQAAFRSDLENLNQQIGSLSSDNDKLSQQAGAQESKVASLLKESRTRAGELEQLRKMMEEHFSQEKEAQEALERISEETSALKDQFVGRASALQELTQKVADYQGITSKLHNTNNLNGV